MPDIGYYTLPVIVSMEGIDKQVNSKLGKAFEGIGKKAGKDIGTGIAPGAKAAESDLKKLADSYGRLKDKAADSLGKVRKEEAALADLRAKGVTSGSRFVAVEERLATARRNSTRAVNDAKRAHGDLEAGQKALAGGSDKLKGKLGDLSGIASKAGAAIGAVGIVAGGAALVGVAALGAGVVVLGKQLYDLGGQFDEISDNFIIKLGATGEKLEELNQQVLDLGPTLALPLKDIGALTAEMNRAFAGSTTTQIENLTQAVGDLNRMTGTSTDIKKFRQVLVQWNIPMQDSVKTLDMLLNVSRKTGKPVNDLLEIITSKGAVGLRELNIPLESALGLLAQLQEAGLEAAAGVDALAKANKYANTEGISMSDALTRAFDAIRVGDDKLAQTIFGVKGSADLIEAVRNGKLTIQDFYAALEEGGPTIAETAALTDDFAEKWQKLKNRLEVAIKPVASAIFDGINNKLNEISDWAIAHQDQVLEFIGKIGEGLFAAGQGAMDFAKGVLTAFKGILEGYNQLPWPFGPDEPVDTSFIDAAITSIDGVKAKLTQGEDWWKGYIARAASAVKLTQRLGDTVRAVLNKDNQIEISTNTPEVQASLKEIGIQVKEVTGPDGVTQFILEPIVGPEAVAGAQQIIDDWKAQNEKDPIAPPVIPDTTAGQAKLDEFFGNAGDVVIAPTVDPNILPSNLPAIGPGGNPAGGSGGTPDRLTPTASSIWHELREMYPAMDLWGWGPNPDHNNSKCIDVMTGDTPGGLALGDRIVAHYLKDPRVKHIIWKQQWWEPGKPPEVMAVRAGGDRNQNHFTHPHIETRMQRGGGLSGYGGGDKIPALLEAGEHVLDKDDVKNMGGHVNVYKMRDSVAKHPWTFARGGDILKPNPRPGSNPAQIAFPEWGTPGSKFGPPGGDWWRRPLNPDDVLFPEWMPPGQRDRWLEEWGRNRKKIQGLGFEEGGRVPDWDAIAQKESGGRWNINFGDADSTGGLQIQTRTWLDFGGDKYAPTAGQATKAEQIAIAEKILAVQGPEAWAGGRNFVWKAGNGAAAGTPHMPGAPTYTRGTGPSGEPGYYKPADAEKQQALQNDIDELEGKIREQQAKIAELEADATESEKLSAQNELDSLNRQKAVKQTELSEAEQGEFVAGEPPTTHYEPYPASVVADAEAKAADAQAELDVALARQRELKADASESEKIAAQNAVDEAKRKKAAADAEAAEKRRGKLTEGDEDGTGGTHEVKIDPMLNQLAAMPGGIINGLLADLGIGDIFPDLTQTPMWKSFAAGITALKGPIQGAVEGRLGIQQPGWRPGMPIPEPAGSGEPQTGGGGFSIPGMFGLPDIGIPPPPPAPAPPGQGTGPPPGPVNIDASTNYVNSPIGANPVDAARADAIASDNALSRVTPIVPHYGGP